MAKVTEGDPYYYAPSTSGEINYCIFKRGTQSDLKCIAVDVSQDNASLIVDALNFYCSLKEKLEAQRTESTRNAKAKFTD